MIRKTTTQLLKELENFNTFEEYENANRDSMISKNLSEYLTDLLNERNLTKAEVIRKAELSDGYAYQIFSGLKTAPKRDKLICLSVGMGLSVNETNSVLKIAGLSPLYPKIKRDSIIIINIVEKSFPHDILEWTHPPVHVGSFYIFMSCKII